ncbi:hypothetical protein JCM8097_002892 [Rhodosporidiobolus ruineniae]
MPPPPIPPRPGQAAPPLSPRPPPAGPLPPSWPPTCCGQLLADGNGQQAGVLGKGIKWQASSPLEVGSNLPGHAVYIQNPLTIHMGPPATCVDAKGRQRTEILSWPPAAAGQTWLYQWRFHLAGPVPTSSKFFHLTQLLSRESGGFVVALGLVNNKVKISSILPPLVDPQTGKELTLPGMDAERYWNRTTYHRAQVQWGPGGFVDYSIADAITGEPLLRYCVSNVGNVPAQGSIKCGLYRAHVCSAATAVCGDFDFRPL